MDSILQGRFWIFMATPAVTISRPPSVPVTPQANMQRPKCKKPGTSPRFYSLNHLFFLSSAAALLLLLHDGPSLFWSKASHHRRRPQIHRRWMGLRSFLRFGG